jgi:hypothetical protein
VLHKVLLDLHKNKISGFTFKIKFENALLVLEMKGFPGKFIDMSMSVITSGKVEIKINVEIGPYFSNYQGL